MQEEEGISSGVIVAILIILLVTFIGLGALYYKYKKVAKIDQFKKDLLAANLGDAGSNVSEINLD